MRFRIIVGLAGLLAGSSFGQITGSISTNPRLAPAEVAKLEAAVRANPADSATRLRLLRFYMMSRPAEGDRRSPLQYDRLSHILYWIEHKPSDPIASSDLTYVPSLTGPFADPADHASVQDAWIRAVEQHPDSVEVLVNATRFIYRENPDDAEQMLSRVLARDPANRRVAANLGFLYALDILGVQSPEGMLVLRTDSERDTLQQRARGELERNQNVFVLAGAGTALPNLFPRTPQSRVPGAGQSVFELATRLMARARELAPNEPALQGVMPLSREFYEFQRPGVGYSIYRIGSDPEGQLSSSKPSVLPGTIQVGGTVQAAKLVEKPEASYPALALEARIQGTVRFNVMIGKDGRTADMTLISGHPLLVAPATAAARAYRYQPTLLNGNPVQVTTQIDVPFVLPQ